MYSYAICHSYFLFTNDSIPKISAIFAVSKPKTNIMTKIIALLNHKGGVGKSCSTQNIAAALHQLKKKVLVIDLDGQANLTESMGASIEEPQTIYGALKGEYPMPLMDTESGIALVPSCLDLSAAESELINEPGREMILRGLIAKTTSERKFDYILIDCPPSLGLLTLNALTAADYLIIPVQAQFLAMRGMAKLMNVIQIVQERLNPSLKIGGIVITQFDSRKTLNKSVSELIRESFCDKVFKTFIRDNVALAEAPVRGKNIFEYSPRSYGAQDYLSLAKEVLKLK
jgi:chromosome partitioning protein